MLGGDAMQLARLGATQERALDHHMIGNAAPVALEVEATLSTRLRYPRAFGVMRVDSAHGRRKTILPGGFIQLHIKRAVQRQRLDDPRVIAARHIAHHSLHLARMLDKLA